MEIFNNILCATDGSESGLRAVQAAHKLTQLLGARLTVLHVAPLRIADYMVPHNSMGGEDLFPSQLEERLKEHSTAILESVKATLNDANVEFLQQLGHPGDTICHLAKERGADLVVVGCQGHSALRRLLLGSTSDFVVHNCSATVMVIKD